jgi:hypothetical protein
MGWSSPDNETNQLASGVPVDLTKLGFTASYTDSTDDYRYYGGEIGSAWKINRYSATTFVKTSATIANNPGQASLAAAWASRLTLTYA